MNHRKSGCECNVKNEHKLKDLLLGGIGICLFLIFFIEIIAIYIRISGGIYSVPHLANHLSILTLLLSRVSTALALVGIGFALDSGIDPTDLAITYFAFLSLLSIALVFCEKFKKALDRFLIEKIVPNGIAIFDYEMIETSPREDKFLVLNVAIGLFLILGFCLPSLFASVYHEYRATLMQLGFVFNSIATLISAFYVEKKIALALHLNCNSTLARLNNDLIISRKYSAFIGAILALIVMLYR